VGGNSSTKLEKGSGLLGGRLKRVQRFGEKNDIRVQAEISLKHPRTVERKTRKRGRDAGVIRCSRCPLDSYEKKEAFTPVWSTVGMSHKKAREKKGGGTKK